jgi:RNA polymerase sigma factor (sigma-70 family)
MIVPSGMTHDQVIKQIDKVINRIAPRYTFYGYTVDDMKQEAFIMCMDALSRYEPPRPLENFLSVHLSNRMKNFVRDNHFTNTDDEDRVKVFQPAQLDHEHALLDYRPEYSNEEKIDYNSMQKIINHKLPANMRMDYLKMINDVYITKQRREEITIMIREILVEYGYEKRQD